MIYIDTKSTDIFYNMACETYFGSEKILDDDVFLIWHTTPTLTIGRFQNTLEEIDAEYAREHGICVTRRSSGGGTCYLDEGGWQFSYIAQSKGNDLSIDFAQFVVPVIKFLRSLGLEAELSGRNDIMIAGKKVSGNSQFRLGSVVIHHGTLLFDTNLDNLERVTTPKAYKITSKAIASVRERVTNIRSHLPADMGLYEFRDALAASLTDREYVITEEDACRIREIADRKFRDPAMIYASTPKFEMEKEIHLAGGTFVIGMCVNDGIITEAGVSGDFFSASDIDIADLLKGVRYTPDDVKKALAVLDGALFEATADDLTRGIFE